MGRALQMAKHPGRIHFRVLQAMNADRGDVACAERFTSSYLKDICKKAHDRTACEEDVLGRMSIWTIPLEEGMGPAHQRGLLNELLRYQGPDAICVTTDSHMDFHHDWDELTLADWSATDNEFAVLTAYPFAMAPDQEAAYAHSKVDLCGYWLENGIPRGKTGGNLVTFPGDKPYLTMNWAAGLSIHRCHADRNVPVDKNLKFIFTGEEVSRAVRLWTHGYDLYLPTAPTIYHDYGAAKQDFWKFRAETQAEDSEMSRKRLAALLQLDDTVAQAVPAHELEPYGPGQQRTLEQWVEWSRVDLGTRRWREFLAARGKPPVESSKTQNGGHDYCQTLKRMPVRDVQSLRASALARGPPPGGNPDSSPAKRTKLSPPTGDQQHI